MWKHQLFIEHCFLKKTKTRYSNEKIKNSFDSVWYQTMVETGGRGGWRFYEELFIVLLPHTAMQQPKEKVVSVLAKKNRQETENTFAKKLG